MYKIELRPLTKPAKDETADTLYNAAGVAFEMALDGCPACVYDENHTLVCYVWFDGGVDYTPEGRIALKSEGGIIHNGTIGPPLGWSSNA